MSHEIYHNTLGQPSYVFDQREGAGWHGLGIAIPEEIATDPAKIAALCGADYNVSKRPVHFLGANGRPVAVPNREAIVRDDTEEALEVLSGNRYNVHQPIGYFEAFRDQLAKNHLRISSAGVLKGGRVLFVNAKIEDLGFKVMGEEMQSYVTLGGGYDGKMSTFGYLSNLRTLCWNTLSTNLGQAKSGKTLMRFPHTSPFDGDILTSALGLSGPELAVRAEVFNTLAGRKLQAERVAQFFADVLEVKDVAKASGKIKAQLEALAKAYVAGPGADSKAAAGTVWGALNAVTFYVDHEAGTRDSYKDGTAQARFASAKFGTGADTKARALQLAMQLANIDDKMLLAA
jgi:phage/plasmid-like protein (TIGR03299 family)